MTPRFWSTRSEVERVDLYTRWSLYFVHLTFAGLMLVALARSTGEQPWPVRVATVVGALLGVEALRLLRAGLDGGRPRVTPLAVVLLVAAGLTLLLPPDPRTAAVVVLAVHATFGVGAGLGRRGGALLALVCGAVALVLTDLGTAAYAVLLVVVGLASIHASLWLLGVVRELDGARRTQASLAVAEERLRFSRDVHDVLGRRLAAIGMQAELAATLARRGDPGAEERMLEVRDTAHDALTEARALARGYREVSWQQEIEGATALLASADITVEADLAGLPVHHQEPAAWVVREAVTNVLRHSSATAVAVRYADGVLHVDNDRPRPTGGVGGTSGTSGDGDAGVGLAGLAERLAARGGRLDVTREPDRFALTADLGGAS